MTPWALRNFLICQPQPVTIRLRTSDGEIQEMVPAKRSRVKLAESILAIGPELIECLDGKGNLIRAIRPDQEVDSGGEPSPPAVIAQDPNAAMISHFANLLHRAYEHATDVAFAKLIELVERMDARSESIEQRLERTESQYRRLQQERIDDMYERADEHASGGDMKDAIMSSLVQGAMQGQASSTAAAAKGNGKA